MKLVFPVGLRAYESGLYIAQTTVAPLVSSAAESADAALKELRDSLEDLLRRTHPRVLWKLQEPPPTRTERKMVPVYKTAAYDWYHSPSNRLEIKPVESEVDVHIKQLESGLVEVTLPLFDISTYAPRPEDTTDDQPPEDVAIEDLARVIRSDDTNLAFHRPRPKEFTVISLEIDFEPLDLRELPPDTLWADVFPDELLDKNSDTSAPATPVLDAIGQNWTTAADEATDRGFQEAFLRDTILDELRGLTFGDVPSAVVLVGPSRVGKTALVKHLVWEQRELNTSSRRIWFADPPRLVSTDPMSPGWQQQCRDVITELEETGDVLYMGRLIESLDAGKYVGSDYNLAQFLKPSLADRRMRIIGKATVEEWNHIERRDIGFARGFTVIRIDDLAPELSERIAVTACQRMANKNGIEVPLEALKRAWNLQRRFATEGSPVGRTIDFLGRTLRQALNAYKTELNEEDLVNAFCKDTGLPPVLLQDDIRLDLEDVKTQLKRRVMGQSHAVERVADVIGIAKAGLASEERPLGSFLFVGPTGVGKTELARALAQFLFGDDSRLIRIDMSEYSHADAYNRLIGEGREDGDLTGPIRRQPFSVVLLDELEKANPSVFDLLLQVLGEARLTDVNGRTTRFHNTIIVMTSNLGVDTLRPAIGFEAEEDVVASYASHFRREAERFFRPEFLARIDQFIPFSPLTPAVVESIASRELSKVIERDGIKSQDVELSFGSDVASWLGKEGFDEKYGARPLKRVIEQELVWRLAAELSQTQASVHEDATRLISVTVAKDALKFETEIVSGDATRASARQLLLRQIDEISELRRRLQRYTFTNVFSDLEWEVDNFDISSQSSAFWNDSNAASMATRAEHARRVIDPVNEVELELGALEDLANEAFHARTFAISNDLTERLGQLQERVNQITLTVLRAAYEDPDHGALFLVSRTHDDPWRNKLVQWYLVRAKALGWKVKLFRPIPDASDIERPEDSHYDMEREFWEEIAEPIGLIVAIEMFGYAVRPMLRTEDGIHRQVASDGNAAVEVLELDEYDEWPYPDSIESGRHYATVIRTYNFRSNEILIPGHKPLKFNAQNPWEALDPVLEDLVWEITESEWE